MSYGLPAAFLRWLTEPCAASLTGALAAGDATAVAAATGAAIVVPAPFTVGRAAGGGGPTGCLGRLSGNML